MMGARIMIVDDSRSFRMLLSHSLRQAGYEVIEAADGEVVRVDRDRDGDAQLVAQRVDVPREVPVARRAVGVDPPLAARDLDDQIQFLLSESRPRIAAGPEGPRWDA